MSENSYAVVRLMGILALQLTLAGTACGDDVDGGKDHPLVGRFKDSSIVFYKAKEFDELTFLKALHDYGALLDRNATDDRSGPEWLTLQGRATEIRYEIPAGRSALEVVTNYDLALKAKGFQPVFSCADKACFTGSMNDNYLLGQQLDPGATGFQRPTRRTRATCSPNSIGRKGPLRICERTCRGRWRPTVADQCECSRPRAWRPSNITAVKANRHPDGTSRRTGSINIYGVQFDFDKDVVKAEVQANSR